jgi:hypothetical protein
MLPLVTAEDENMVEAHGYRRLKHPFWKDFSVAEKL